MARQPSQKIRIVLRAFDHKTLDLSATQIVETAEQAGAVVAGPVPLPTHIRRFCVIRSPHVDKDSREHFELRTHNRLIDILEPTSKTIDSLTRLNVPAGVDNVGAEYQGIGIRIEDSVVVCEDGCEVLTAGIPKEIEDIESSTSG